MGTTGVGGGGMSAPGSSPQPATRRGEATAFPVVFLEVA